MREKIVKLNIEGMSCAHCESKIEDALKQTAGVLEAKVSYNGGTALIAYDEDVTTVGLLKDAIRAEGYTPAEEIEKTASEKVKDRPQWTNILGVLLILFGAFWILNQLNVFAFVNVFPTATAGATGFGMLFVIGLLTSVHCVAMCGGINISQNVHRDTGPPASSSAPDGVQPAEAVQGKGKFKLDARTFRSGLLYNAGRVVSYTVIGFIVGALGSVLAVSGTVKGIIMLVAAVFMMLMGLNMLGVLPILKWIMPRMPKFIAKRVNAQKIKSNSPLVVGLLNGLMPCGPLQAMQIYALSTGSAFLGALSMFLFSLGTVPLMFAVGALSSILTKKFAKKVMTVSAVLVVVMGLFMLGNGTALAGIALPQFMGGTGPVIESTVDIEGNIQTVSFELTAGGYKSIKVKRGIPVVWTIEAAESALTGCNGEIKIPKYDMTVRLTVGVNVVWDGLVVERSGTVPYSCWMGMKKAKIIVYD